MKFAISLLFLSATHAQQVGSLGGTIVGTLSGEDGATITRGRILARRQISANGKAIKRDHHADAGAQGVFRIDRLPDGKYDLCVEVPDSDWLNPCEWGMSRPTVTISRTLRTVNLPIVLSRGAVLSIRLDDPGVRLAQHEGKTSGAHLLLGVSGDNNVFRPSSITSRDANGRDYQSVVPFARAVRLVVSSYFFQLKDAAGVTLPENESTTIPLAIPRGQTRTTIRLIVSGNR